MEVISDKQLPHFDQELPNTGVLPGSCLKFKVSIFCLKSLKKTEMSLNSLKKSNHSLNSLKNNLDYKHRGNIETI